ncbi:MAG: glycosyltransferase family 39 protein, partial [Ardenticatenaceae bacterium]
MNRSLFRILPLLLLTLFSTTLQFWALDAQSLWYDEGFSVWLSQKPVSEIIAITAADIQPPLYYLLLHGWIRLTGQSEWALRFFSAFFAVLAVPLMWQVARRLLKQRAAADVAALLVALSPLWLWYGREVRNYSLGLALLLAAAWYLLPLLKEHRQKEIRGKNCGLYSLSRRIA